MKKMLAVFLTLVMLFTCAFSTVSLAETAQALTEAQQAEMAAVMEWLMKDIPKEEYMQVFSWDRDTILKKLEGYDQPLEAITKEEIADLLSQVTSVFGAFAGMLQGEGGGEGFDLSGLMGLFGGFSDDSSDWGDEYGYIDENFNGTYWESGDMKLESVFQDGYFKILITEGEKELVYLCEQDPETLELKGIGTGDEELTEAQPDHGVATFAVIKDGVLIWTKANGGEVTFTEIIDPLDCSRWFGNDKQAAITWLGDLNYEVRITDLASIFDEWDYLCVLNEEKDVLEGSGHKTNFSTVIYSASPVTFAFQDGRTKLVWTDEAEPAAKEGLTLEAVERVFTENSIWEAEKEGITVYTDWVDRYYHVQVFYGESVYEYLCNFDRETNTLTAVDPAGIDFDAYSLYMDKGNFTSTGTFVLETDDTLVWHDDSGVSGDGIVLKHW